MVASQVPIAARPSGGDNRVMDISDFLAALGAIVVIDLMLAGDNAIVIALAARNVPAHLQKRAIAWGTVGAVAVRSLMTIGVVWLLKIPGLLLAGGAVLVWIAYKLLLPDESHGAEAAGGTRTVGFWGAMRTIVVADAVMGLDNVLAVAGAARGSYVLVVAGLLISVPIVVWGSSFLLRWVERYPIIVYFGSGVLAWTAVKMVVSEPLLHDTFAAREPYLAALLYLVVIAGVLLAGFIRNGLHLESRIHARLAALAAERRVAPPPPEAKGAAMQSVLVPIGDARNAQFALRRIVQEFIDHPGLHVHLLNVQMPFSRHVAQFARRKARDDFHRSRAEAALKPARALLDRHNIPYSIHVRVGDRARAIVDEAKRLGCDHIVMATARKNSLTRMLENSTTNRVLELTTIPVELIAGDQISRLERYGIPAGIGAALALLVAAALD
jgi:YjbE family integral membrane protein